MATNLASDDIYLLNMETVFYHVCFLKHFHTQTHILEIDRLRKAAPW